MGHMAGKDIYRQLGGKIDSLTMRAPWSETLYAILKELYTPQEAELVVQLPCGLATIDRIAALTGKNEAALRPALESLCNKGLVMDVWLRGQYHYTPSPMVIGIFEFTMMRSRGKLNTSEWARLFHQYMLEDDAFFAANHKNGEQVSIMRTLPYSEAVPEQYIEILDYEKAAALVDAADIHSIGTCSCRHEKLHVGKKKCTVPLDTCSSFGFAADYLIRRNLARKATKTEMLDNLARSKELGLVLNADNVQQNITFICHCCGCCCNALAGISRFGYPNAVVTSSFIAEVDPDKCQGCGKCARACAIGGITMTGNDDCGPRAGKRPCIDQSLCLGCGVCALRCDTGAVTLAKRGQRVIHPVNTFEKTILRALEKGTLQNLLFDNPHSGTQKFMRFFVGAFAKLPPVKKALMSDMLRSRFLQSMELGAKLQGKAWLTRI